MLLARLSSSQSSKTPKTSSVRRSLTTKFGHTRPPWRLTIPSKARSVGDSALSRLSEHCTRSSRLDDRLPISLAWPVFSALRRIDRSLRMLRRACGGFDVSGVTTRRSTAARSGREDPSWHICADIRLAVSCRLLMRLLILLLFATTSRELWPPGHGTSCRRLAPTFS